MTTLQRPANLTPWAVYVYDGYGHWKRQIDELTEAFTTRYGAEVYADTISRLQPGYFVKIVKET